MKMSSKTALGRPKNQDTEKQNVLFREHFEELMQNGKLASSTSEIFKSLGHKLGKTPKTVYLAVKRDIKQFPEHYLVEPQHRDVSYSSDDDESIIEDSFEANNDNVKEIMFSGEIDRGLFKVDTHLKKKRGSQIVQKYVKAGWSDHLFDIVWKEKKTKCAWSFRHAYVNVNGGISFDGDCTECNAVLKATTNDSLSKICVKIIGYQEEYVHMKRRYVRGEKRVQMAEKLKDKSVFSVYRDLCDELIENENDGMPPHVPKPQVLNQIKYVSSIEDNKSAVENILKWKNTSMSFRNTIFDVGCSPFFIKYQLPTQAEFYIKECHLNSKIAISIDATGSIILPPKDSEISTKTQKPKHIFLYNIMVKTESTSVPICQMVSQRHTALFISYWLEEIFTKMPSPSEVVCDGSKALILALVKALTTYRTTNEYKQACIKSLEDGFAHPECFLRLDRSHFCEIVSRNITYRNPLKQKLFRSIFGFLMQCDCFEDAKVIILDLFTLIMNKYDGSKGEIVKPVEKSKIHLTTLCATHELEITEEITNTETVDDMSDDETGERCGDQENGSDDNVDWLHEIMNRVPIIDEDEWSDLTENAYFCAYDQKKIMRLLSDIFLWSNVMVSVFGSPYTTATSQDVESNFKTLKCFVLNQKMVRPDKFLLVHANYLKTEIKTRIAESFGNRSKHRSCHEKGIFCCVVSSMNVNCTYD